MKTFPRLFTFVLLLGIIGCNPARFANDVKSAVLTQNQREQEARAAVAYLNSINAGFNDEDPYLLEDKVDSIVAWANSVARVASSMVKFNEDTAKNREKKPERIEELAEEYADARAIVIDAFASMESVSVENVPVQFLGRVSAAFESIQNSITVIDQNYQQIFQVGFVEQAPFFNAYPLNQELQARFNATTPVRLMIDMGVNYLWPKKVSITPGWSIFNFADLTFHVRGGGKDLGTLQVFGENGFIFFNGPDGRQIAQASKLNVENFFAGHIFDRTTVTTPTRGVIGSIQKDFSAQGLLLNWLTDNATSSYVILNQNGQPLGVSTKIEAGSSYDGRPGISWFQFQNNRGQLVGQLNPNIFWTTFTSSSWSLELSTLEIDPRILITIAGYKAINDYYDWLEWEREQERRREEERRRNNRDDFGFDDDDNFGGDDFGFDDDNFSGGDDFGFDDDNNFNGDDYGYDD